MTSGIPDPYKPSQDEETASIVPLRPVHRGKTQHNQPPRQASISIVSSNAIVAARRDRAPEFVSFQKAELDILLNLYGRRVAEGEWRDYAIDSLKDRAVFSIFRRSSEMPIYQVEKDPARKRKQGLYSVVAAGGLVMKRGADLRQVLRVLDRRGKIVSL